MAEEQGYEIGWQSVGDLTLIGRMPVILRVVASILLPKGARSAIGEIGFHAARSSPDG